MYKVCGFTNYQCTCGDDEEFAIGITLKEAIDVFLRVIRDNLLDFTYLDSWIDDWADEDDDFESYGGSIYIFDEAKEDSDFDREIVMVRVERDPLKKTNVYGEIQLGPEILDEEKELFISLK